MFRLSNGKNVADLIIVVPNALSFVDWLISYHGAGKRLQ